MNNQFEELEKTRQMSITEKILDHLDTCIYVSDPITYEILFINSKMSEAFGSKDLTGKICWQVLQTGMTEPCPFCPTKELLANPGKVIVWEELNTVTGQYYNNTDSIIIWDDGRQVHIQHSVDITPLKLSEKVAQEQARKKDFLANISINFASMFEFDRKIFMALKYTGEFLNLRSAVIVKDLPEQEMLEYVYAWGIDINQDEKYVVKRSIFDPTGEIYYTLCKGQELVINSTSNLTIEKKEIWETINVKSFVAIPILIQNKFWGLFACEALQDPYEWSEYELSIIHSVCDIISNSIERNEIEEILYATKETLQKILDSIPAAVFWKDVDSTYLGCNKKFSSFIGYQDQEIVGKNNYDFLDEKEALARTEEDGYVLKNNLPLYNIEVKTKNHKGEERYININKVPLCDQNNNPNSVLGIFEDITEKKKVQLKILERDIALKKAIKVAEKSNKAKSEFLSRISHEIRTPMNAIVGMSNIASGADELSKVKLCLSKIDIASKQLLGIINDILDISKIEEGKLKILTEKFNLEKMLIHVCDVVIVKMEEKKQNFHILIEPEVPVEILGDELRLTQVLMNLLTNAAKFTNEEGEIKLHISVSNREENSIFLQFKVMDNGIGISEDDQKRMFTPFEQANGSITRKYGGTGLGLAICKQLVRLMGGDITLESKEGYGSTFIFDIKAEVISDDIVTTAIFDKDLNILIIDDNLETCQLFHNILCKQHIQSDYALNGYEAINKMQKATEQNHPFNMIFVDWYMPDMDGLVTIHKIKEMFGEHMVIVIISIAEWNKIESKAKNIGVHKFLSKPIFPSTAMNVINEVLGKSVDRELYTKNPVPNFEGKNILIAEDVEMNREVIEALLEETKAKIEFAEDGIIVVDKFRNNPEKYDIILMDIHMPKCDGYEATRFIRESQHEKAKEIPIIAMTADIFAEEVERCFAAGMNDHLGKPIDHNKLFKKLENIFKVNTITPENTNTVQNHEIPDSSVNKSRIPKAGYMPYINVKDGLIRLQKNKKLFTRLMNSFKNNNIYHELVIAIHNQDIKQAQLQAHALKGATGNLSFTKTYEMLIHIDKMLKDGILPQEEEVAKFQDAYEITIECIDALIEEFAQQE